MVGLKGKLVAKVYDAIKKLCYAIRKILKK